MTRLALFLLCALALSGCAGVPLVGGAYTDIQYSEDATANPIGNRVGEACAVSYLGLVATGDASIEAARRNGGITMISTVDKSHKNILFFYAKNCTIVRGR